MFGIDISEIMVIFLVALVVLGPEKLPKLANTVGRWVGRARAMARQFREQLEQEAETLQRSVDLRETDKESARAPAYVPPSSSVAQGYQPPHLGEDVTSGSAAPGTSEPPPADPHERGH
jgi:sec-independent protein translocase protein TatB